MSITLNENNIQAPFQYRIGENTFELKTVSGELYLSSDNVQVKVFEGERLFCADIGYAVDGALELMEFLINNIRVYPHLLNELKDLKTVAVKDNEIYLIKDDINFKSIIFFPLIDLNQKFNFRVTTYSSTFSSFMFDDIAVKLNKLDENIPIKNYYRDESYEVNDIIKHNAYLYRVFKKFTSDGTDYHLKANCSLLTPFKKLELNNSYKSNELVEYNNNFFIVQKDFLYSQANGTLTNLNGLLKPLQDIVVWFDGISRIYKNQIIIKDNILYKVLEDVINPVWGSIQNKIENFIKAYNVFYDDSNTSFGSNIDNVQKAVETLNELKQDKLIAGSNIILNRNNISVNGGTNKEYTEGSFYFINDLIVYENNLYRVNENFTASNWNSDISKCTLISTGGGGSISVKASDVSFDNSIAKLQKLTGYDYPKFKVPIPNTINLTFEDNFFGDGSTSSASIVKENDGYRLKGNISVTNTNDGLYATFYVNNKLNIYENYSIISQFFNFINNPSFNSNNYIDAETGEIIVDGIESEWKFCFAYSALYSTVSKCKLYIAKKDGSSFNSGTYNITLNIKNRVLKPEDRNIFAINSNFQQSFISSLCNLELKNIGGSVKLQGTFTSSIYNVGTADGLYFYSPIIENYFNLSDSSSLVNTTGITSSTGKSVKFGIVKITDTPANDKAKYLLVLEYQDGSNIQQGDVFTFNLAPDKNASLNPIYEDAANVQQMGEALNNKIINAVSYPNLNQEIQIGTDPEGYKLFRRVTLLDYEFIADGEYHTIDTFKIPNETGIIKRFYKVDIWAILKSTNNIEAKLSLYQGDSNIRIVLNGVHYTIFENDKWWSDNYKGLYCVYEYTKEK